jgi:hypothetical protein
MGRARGRRQPMQNALIARRNFSVTTTVKTGFDVSCARSAIKTQCRYIGGRPTVTLEACGCLMW